MKIAVLGAGAWGTALSIAFSARHAVDLWTREADVLETLRVHRENSRFFPGFRLPDSVRLVSEVREAVQEADLVLIATSVAGLRPTLHLLRDLPSLPAILWVCKGFEAYTGLLPHQVVRDVLGEGIPHGALSGPSFAEEVASGQPTAVALAGSTAEFAREMAAALTTPRFRIYANHDLVGVEVGGAVKNVLAIASGVCDGLGLGLNTRAALMTRGLAEIARLGVALGAQRDTFMGLAGMGDLILTCTGDLSRNRRVGLALASGQTLAQILEDLGHVAEGVSTAREVVRLAQAQGVDMPISAAVTAILAGSISAREAVDALMRRDPREELA